MIVKDNKNLKIGIGLMILLLFPFFVNAADYSLLNPLGIGPDQFSVPVLIGYAVRLILGLVGSLSLIYFVIGGFYFVTASGNDERIRKGKHILSWASIGLVLAFASYALIAFVVSSLEKIGG